jgi:ABC-type branched-subunit amino acid transport system substrate-binding protein
MSVRPSDRPADQKSAGWSRRCLAAVVALGMTTVAACTEPAAGPVPAGPADAGAVRLYGSDGNMTSSFGGTFKDQGFLLNGMRGTSPLTPLSEDFKRRLRAVDPKLTNDFLYAAEGYDAVIIAALAAETARSVEGPQIAKYMTAVTVSKERTGICDTVTACLDGVRAGRDIAYRGVSMQRSGLTDGGEPSSASYGTLVFGPNQSLDDAKTEYVPAGDEKNEAKELPAAPSNGRRPVTGTPLKIGSLLPKTGDLAIAGPPIFAGVQLAINEINAAGGILGKPVEYTDGDDGTDPKVAGATVDRLLAAGVQVIVGAAASGITKAVMPKVVQAQRVLISPSATSDELSGLPDNGFFFRTSPPDVLQSKALTDVIMRYGARRIVIIARNDSYGLGLRDKVAEQLKAAGVRPDSIRTLDYEVRDQYKIEDFAPQAQATIEFEPDSVLVIGFAESGNMIKALSAGGMKFRD